MYQRHTQLEGAVFYYEENSGDYVKHCGILRLTYETNVVKSVLVQLRSINVF